MRRLTTKEFIKRAKDKHGDFFDYTDTVYVNRRTKVHIICPVHGGFWQYPEIHIKSAYGCPMCGHEGGGIANRDGFDSFIKKAIDVHGNKYSYKNVDYVDSKTKVEIICPKHGAYMQTPVAHISGHGCPICGLETIKQKGLFSQKEVIEKFREVHGNRYDYSRVKYKGLFTKVEIICKEHGAFFQQPSTHIHQGCGCPECRRIKIGMLRKQTKEEFVEKARLVHGNKYDYSLVAEESLSIDKIPIICPEHGLFMQEKNNHLRGHGCPHCPKSTISKGEDYVANVLNKINIDYIPQYKIVNDNLFCLNKHFYVDFYIPSAKIIIEYNGEQHYKATRHFGGEKKLHDRQERDMALRQYCREHGIKLIEIPYWDFDKIETIITNKLK